MEADRMNCPKGGNHHYEWARLDGVDRMMCEKCGHLAEYKPTPSQAELLTENESLKAELETKKGTIKTLNRTIKKFTKRQLEG